MPKVDPTKHILVPKHSKLSEAEQKKLFDKHNINFNDLPIILASDPAITHLKLVKGDVVKIDRDSPTAGKSEYFRGVQ
ncbi:DNA-directed RNA polymerase subunit H [Candidatus Woesearchaeota archaeon]|nr:DNA-directed RNA polymerase subunit H [Candidatus Woesearchaeota archaeon]